MPKKKIVLSRGEELMDALLVDNPLLDKAVGAVWSASAYVKNDVPGVPVEYVFISISAVYNNGQQEWKKLYTAKDAAALLPVLKDWLDLRYPDGIPQGGGE